MRTHLDFVVIGAQKSGTTSLFAHLAAHPEVAVPPEKEAPFFTGEAVDAGAWRWYLDDYFARADERRRWGTVTPQYMSRPGVAQRMAELMPDCRLVALLRHPVARSLSHHQMVVKRDGDRRSADLAISQCLEPAELEAARHDMTAAEREECGYVVRGEYGRILGGYLDVFPAEQLLVVFLDEMEDDPLGTWTRIATHLQIDATWIPPRLEVRRHVGGTERKVTSVYALRRSNLVRAAWRMVPAVPRRRARFWFDQWNVRPAATAPLLSPDIEAQLLDHFRSDVARLEHLLGRPVPWDDLR